MIRGIEIVGRGVTQTANASAAANLIAHAATLAGKGAMSYTRYGDAPDRVGIPLKAFALVADSFEELEERIMTWEPESVDVVMVLDAPLIKGTESWGHQGLRPVMEKLVDGGVIIVNTDRAPEDLIKYLPGTSFGYKLTTIDGSGMSALYHVPLLGALAELKNDIAPGSFLEKAIYERYGRESDVETFRNGKNVRAIEVAPKISGQRIENFTPPVLPTWKEMSDYTMIPNPKPNTANPDFKGATTRSRRPIIDYEKCTNCALCWVFCPDGAVMHRNDKYEINYEYCKGCGICAEECNPEAITMRDELEFLTWEVE